MEEGFWSKQIGQLQKSLRGLLDGQRTSTMLSLQNATKNVMQLFEAGQRSVSPSVFNLQVRCPSCRVERFSFSRMNFVNECSSMPYSIIQDVIIYIDNTTPTIQYST